MSEQAQEGGYAYFRVRGRSFRCAARVSFWLVAKVAHLERKGASDAEAVPVTYELVMSMIHESERDQADAYLAGLHDITQAELNESIVAAFAEMGAVGKASPSPSVGGSPSPETSTSRRVVSFSRGTVDEQPIETVKDTLTHTVSSTG